MESLDPSKLYYLASPYSHPDPTVRQDRYEKVNAFAARLSKEYNITVIEPICSGHAKTHLGLSTSFDYWQKSCELFLTHSDGMIVLQLDGWDTSKGVQSEIKFAKEWSIPIVYVHLC